MKNPELFHKTISILVKAYQKGTLIHGSCHACAVGNLVAHCTNREVIIVDPDFKEAAWSYGGLPRWNSVFMTSSLAGQNIREYYYEGEAKREIDSTGYSLYELAKIEKAFESVEVEIEQENSDQHQFDGLMSVVDALMEIHEATKEEAEEAKLLFVK